VRIWDSHWNAAAVLRVLGRDPSYRPFNWSRMTSLAGPRQADIESRLGVAARLRASSAVLRATETKASSAGLACRHAAEAITYRQALQQGTVPDTSYHSTAESAAESAAQCALFRDIYRPPTAAPLVVDKSWLTWQEGTVVKLARGIDQTQDWSRLPILADALEESGCANAELLAHCRSDGSHVRGCWAVDLLLKRPIA
jgi:hypothetical protein